MAPHADCWAFWKKSFTAIAYELQLPLCWRSCFHLKAICESGRLLNGSNGQHSLRWNTSIRWALIRCHDGKKPTCRLPSPLTWLTEEAPPLYWHDTLHYVFTDFWFQLSELLLISVLRTSSFEPSHRSEEVTWTCVFFEGMNEWSNCDVMLRDDGCRYLFFPTAAGKRSRFTSPTQTLVGSSCSRLVSEYVGQLQAACLVLRSCSEQKKI